MSVFFPSYEILRRKISDEYKIKRDSPIAIIPSVYASWLLTSVFTSPISLIKVRLQTRKYDENGLINTFKRVVKDEGIRGLYSGYRVCEFFCVKFSKGHYLFANQFSIYFCLYEPIKLHFDDSRLIPFISAFSSMIAVMFTYPNDFIASRIMYQGKEKQYNGYMDAVKKIIQNEGFLALYTGLASSMSRFVLGSVITFSTYEMMKKL
jgi:hypothetical protein